MHSSKMPCVARPQVAFRVGVSGAAKIAPVQLDRLRLQVAELLSTIRTEVHRCASLDTARRVYDPNKATVLRLISPLADGADRLVASEALACGFTLEAPLPFPQDAYEATFTHHSPEQHAASVAEFKTLLDAAGPRVLTLDGDSLDDIDRRRSYEAVGRLVVRNCDLLIAIWDDEKPARGRGGTADTVLYALRAGVPVWWIHAAKDVPPRWLADILDLPRIGIGEPPAISSQDQLTAYVAKAILPPRFSEPEIDGAWERIIACLRCMAGIQADPLLAYLEETGEPNRKCWNLHPIFIRWLRARGALRYVRHKARRAGRQTADTVVRLPSGAVQLHQPSKPDPKPDRRWPRALARLISEPFRRNDPVTASSVPARLSRAYQHCYRSSYMLVFVCGALALISAVIGLTFDTMESTLTFVELLMLGTVLILVVANELLRWSERYISYRVLGELLRMSQHLHGLGWALPASRVNNVGHSPRHSWLAWFFAATIRATPLATGTFTAAGKTEIKHDIADNLIANQLDFHDRRHRECNGAAHILGSWGRMLFFLTLLFVLVRLALLTTGSGGAIPHVLSLICALLPAASAALFGIRAYEELEVLAEQSEQMHEALSRAQARVRRIRTDRPLASQVLGGELFDVTTIMLSEVAGWAQLFRMKAVEA